MHVAASNWYSTDVNSHEWQAMNFYDSIVRWAVPVFVMISGALFLNPAKAIPFKKIYSKYIFRILTALIFWSMIYALRSYYSTGNIKIFLYNSIFSHYHLWFLYMIITLYMITPFMRELAKSEFLAKYFIVLAIIFAFALPESVNIIRAFISTKYADYADKFINQFPMKFVMGYAGYFMLGYVLSKAEIKHEGIIYIAGITGFALTIILTRNASELTGQPVGLFYQNLSVNVLFESVAVFVLFKKYFNRENKFIITLSRYSFGAYLFHVFALQILRKFGLHSLAFNPVISIPFIALIVFVMSYCVSAVINDIPVLKKYIV